MSEYPGDFVGIRTLLALEQESLRRKEPERTK